MSKAHDCGVGAMEEWNKEAVYDAEIAPLMAQIIAICERESIPVIASFQYAHSPYEEGDAFCTTHLPGVNEAEAFKQAYRAIYRAANPVSASVITVRDSDGKVKSSTVVL